MKKLVFLLLSFAFLTGLKGQQNPELVLRKKTILVDKKEIRIDSFSIQPTFFDIKKEDGVSIPKEDYEVNYTEATLKFKNPKKYFHQKLSLYYITYPSYLKKPIYTYLRPEADYTDSLLLPVINKKNVYQPKPFEGLKTQGSITRGFNAGNSQSLVMQSGMELKIKGDLSSKVKLEAVISDNNMPQAYAGISKSYKEFNYIYMKLSGPNWSAKGGDFTYQQQASYFLKFDRKLQGLQIEAGKKNPLSMTGGIVEGEFNRQKFNGLDGNQGPYLLKGKNGEKYIFIIKDSEKVFINGKPIKKDTDYQIDYEMAEISFKPNIPISSNDRITVEFNYSNQYYLRYLNHNQWQYNTEKGQVQIYTYLEKDDKRHSLLFELDTTAINRLKTAGDKLQNLLIESAKLSSYNPNKILYKKVSTATETYFEFTQENLPDLYEVRFSYLGKNQGDYNIERITAIGKIYKYVGSENGDYAPVIKLVPPTSHNYVGVNWNRQIGNSSFLRSDILVSQTDKNLFSPIDDQDNVGMAANIEITHNLKKDSLFNWDIYGKYRFTHQNFEALDPYVDPEFSYQWQIDSLYGRQHFIRIGSKLISTNALLEGGGEYLSLRNTVSAYRIFLSGQKKFKRFKWRGDNSLVGQKFPSGILNKTNFDNEINIPFKKFSWTHQFHIEKRNKEKNQLPDTLNFAYRFYETKWLQKENTNNELQLGFRIERNDSLQNGTCGKARNNWMLFAQKKVSYTDGKLFLYARWQQIKSKNEGKKTFYNFSIHWEQKWAKKWLTSKAKIESFNGNILRNELIYIETPPGQGIYQWNDYNQNGIKEINEFEIATFSDQARYIKVVLPSRNLLPVSNNLYSLQLVFQARRSQNNSFLSKIYNRLLLETSHQIPIENKAILFKWNPDYSLLKNKTIQNDFFINRSKKKYRLHLSYQQVQNEQLLIIGKQGLKNEVWKIESLHTFNSQLLWEQSFSQSQMEQFSENYPEKNFSIKQLSLEQNFSIIKKNKYQWKLFYKWKNKKSKTSIEKLKMNILGINYLIFPKKKNSFYAQTKFVYNDFKGNPYTPTAFYMLEGLQKGRNFLSELNYKQKINSYLEMLFSYQFRISNKHKGIHTAGIQMKMVF